MSYQVLARKWRPQNFKQMVGQEHVLKALIHALESQRLHHAYLFTGTRGVGKTTIGRILAKCLSCHKGITAEPCGECGACTSIAEGRYVDLIEIDAASRTKVEDMRELLDNVQYAASEGRFKIYLIDEVHMLSQSSFNALLKTLEEPPEHVKFLFATTDPQKLPVTILSRCLQFNLKNMAPERIVGHLQNILGQEQVQFEEPALWALARAADGSMRDALSLTDQAIAYGNHVLTEAGVSTMLGTVDQKKIYRILDALVKQDAAAMLAEVKALADFAPDYTSVLASLISILHRVAIEQAVPGSTDNAMGDQEQVVQYARQLCAEDVQLFYQIALVSRKDLAITPDPQAGLEMALLRMMAFQLSPAAQADKTTLETSNNLVADVRAEEGKVEQSDTQQSCIDPQSVLGQSEPAELTQSSAPKQTVQQEAIAAEQYAPAPDASAPPMAEQPPVDAYEGEAAYVGEEDSADNPAVMYFDDQQNVSTGQNLPTEPALSEELKKKTPLTEAEDMSPDATQASQNETTTLPCSASDASLSNKRLPPSEPTPDSVVDDTAWPKVAATIEVTGMTQNLLLNMALEKDGQNLKLYSDSGHFRLLNRSHEDRIEKAMKAAFGDDKKIVWIEGLQAGQETPMMWRERKKAEMLALAKQNIQADPNVQQLIDLFDARVIDESIQALGEIQ